ncbi:hypothetical protein HZB03_03060 [Candidatus Woesearchaeota archaeon]|nr:hypothetical protein [Candidatus Woesearchaeota archaeon]
MRIILFATAAATLTLGAIGYSWNILRRHDNLLAKAAVLADTNKDGYTSLEEWRRVYQELGVHYNAAHPQELSNSQLEQFIQNHQK